MFPGSAYLLLFEKEKNNTFGAVDREKEALRETKKRENPKRRHQIGLMPNIFLELGQFEMDLQESCQCDPFSSNVVIFDQF